MEKGPGHYLVIQRQRHTTETTKAAGQSCLLSAFSVSALAETECSFHSPDIHPHSEHGHAHRISWREC